MTLLLKNRYEIISKRIQRFLFKKEKRRLKAQSFSHISLSDVSQSIRCLGFSFVLKDSCSSLWDDKKALENRHVLGCGQECLSSVLISFFFVSKAACSSAILLVVSLYCFPTQCSELQQTVAFHLLRNLCTFATLGLA